MKLTYTIAALCLFSVAGAGAQAQFYKIHNSDVAGSGVGQFTTTLPTGSTTGVYAQTTNSFGGLFSLREHPVAWAGIEFNYSFNKFSEQYIYSAYTANSQTNVHEATAAYMFHPHFRKLQPFLNVGGGYQDFVPRLGQNQWRETGLVELGFDIPTSNPHFGFRVQGRTLIYRTPNNNNQILTTGNWVSTEEPTFGVFYRK